MDDINLHNQKMNRDSQKIAFQVLFGRNYRQLCYFAMRILQNQEDAEDVVMDVFLKFYQSNAIDKNIVDSAAFLFKSVKNAALDQLKRQNKTPQLSEDIEYNLFNSDTMLEGEEMYARLLNEVYFHIENLPAQCRTIFKLIFFEGKSTKDIAKQLGLSVQSVRNQKARAIQLLKLKIGTQTLAITLLNLLISQLNTK